MVIIYDILKAIQGKGEKAKPTHVLYKSNLSSQMLKDYLIDLMEKGFVDVEIDKKNRKRYFLTDKGHKYVSEFSVIRNFMSSFDLDE